MEQTIVIRQVERNFSECLVSRFFPVDSQAAAAAADNDHQ